MSGDVLEKVLVSAATLSSYALGAVAVGSPIGAFGGAVYGFAADLTTRVAERCIPVWRQDASLVKTAKYTAHVVSALLVGWKALTVCGLNMNLKNVVILNGVSLGILIGVGLGIIVIMAVADRLLGS